MKITTGKELVLMRAAELLSEALAEKESGDADLLLNIALLKARQEFGGDVTRNPVAMVMPLKILLNGRPE